jgi:hypothetical protein
MPTYEVWYETVVTTPKIKFVVNNEHEAFAAYKAKLDKGDLPGDFVKDFKPRAVEVWRMHK